MTNSPKIVISASRRSDIPAFYMNWFMAGLRQGFFEVINPYNRKISIIPVIQDKVHSIVFWSKNFGPFLKGRYGEKLLEKGYNLFFNFTINSENDLLEPEVPALEKRCEQLIHMCDKFGAQSIQWRFDPICFYTKGGPHVKNNLEDFQKISEKASSCGISRCITSFMDDYRKIRNRVKHIAGFSFIDPELSTKGDILLKMEKTLKHMDIKLFTCCEQEVIDSLPEASSVSAASCIPNDLLMELYGGNLLLKKDPGQRTRKGCGCMVSKDIGSYSVHPCYHNCLFCYANPAITEHRGSE